MTWNLEVGVALLCFLALILWVLVFYIRLKRLNLYAKTKYYPEDYVFKIVTVDDLEIRVLQVGSGPQLVLLHGIASSIFCWRFIIPLLAKSFTITAIDLPGFGESSWRSKHSFGLDWFSENVLKLLDQLKITQTHLVGCSMGGAIALWIAKTNPNRVLSVMALAPATHRSQFPFDAHRVSFLGYILSPWIPTLFIHWISRKVLVRHEILTEENVAHYSAPFLRNRGRSVAALKAVEALRDKRLPQALHPFPCRVLLLWGQNDKLITHKRMSELREILADRCEYAAHPSAGHHVMEDEPEWTVQQIEKFLTGPLV